MECRATRVVWSLQHKVKHNHDPHLRLLDSEQLGSPVRMLSAHLDIDKILDGSKFSTVQMHPSLTW